MVFIEERRLILIIINSFIKPYQKELFVIYFIIIIIENYLLI